MRAFKNCYYICNVYKFGDKFKFVYNLRSFNSSYSENGQFSDSNTQVNDKWYSNIIRAKEKVYELAYCNEWDYFGTLTIDGSRYDRFNIDTFFSSFSQYVRNLNKRVEGYNIKYILVPELHKSGGWHFHGLISGINELDLVKFGSGSPFMLQNSNYKNWIRYYDNFGFNSFGKIKNKQAVAGYILKYISKGFDDTKIEKGRHLYYSSKGLNKAVPLIQFETDFINQDINYINDFSVVCFQDHIDLPSIINNFPCNLKNIDLSFDIV